ncbi:hypothetical protein AX774_g5587 [Zancudomyces culisetae]|uniref:Uncharacterized protein n=1 Tax=Zancudomyces culisetae TaxID=1213189 RepID=A0A1R1PJ80_ZANCU|nr:hypothetical protein AX774_g5587 [Zancudomyces culisetae]|eukprot:OMH80963.1 hypothetical protein AX774_g5587 [Zancudomyces culisetae]
MKRDTGDAKMEGGISELRKITAELQQENIKTNYQIAEILGTSLCDSQQSGKEAEGDNTKGDNGTNLHENFTFERITEYKRRIFDDFGANTSGFSRKSNEGVMKSYEEDVHALDVLYKDRICSIGNRLVTRGYDESKLLLSAKSDILRVERHILKQAKEKSRDNGKCTELMEENKRVLEDLDIVWNNKVFGLVLRMSELETMEKIYSSKLEAAGNNGKIEKRGGIRYLWDIIMYPFGSYNQKGVSRSIMDIDGVDKQSESEIIEGIRTDAFGCKCGCTIRDNAAQEREDGGIFWNTEAKYAVLWDKNVQSESHTRVICSAKYCI